MMLTRGAHGWQLFETLNRLPADWAGSGEEENWETPPSDPQVFCWIQRAPLIPGAPCLCDLHSNGDILKGHCTSLCYQSTETMVSILEFPGSLMLEGEKGWSLVPVRGETCLLERGFTEFCLLFWLPCRTDWSQDSDGPVMDGTMP